MRWYFKSKDAICLGSGLGLRQNMGAQYALEKDHIFPYSALRDNGYPVENRFKYALAQEITNRAILTRTENRAKSDTAASDYLSGVQEKFSRCAPASNVSPKIPISGTWNDSRIFIEERRIILAEELNRFLSGITMSNLDEGRRRNR